MARILDTARGRRPAADGGPLPLETMPLRLDIVGRRQRSTSGRWGWTVWPRCGPSSRSSTTPPLCCRTPSTSGTPPGRAICRSGAARPRPVRLRTGRGSGGALRIRHADADGGAGGLRAGDVDEVRPAIGWFYFSSGPRAQEKAQLWAMEVIGLMREHGGANSRLAVDRCEPWGAQLLIDAGIRLFDAQEPMEQCATRMSALAGLKKSLVHTVKPGIVLGYRFVPPDVDGLAPSAVPSRRRAWLRGPADDDEGPTPTARSVGGREGGRCGFQGGDHAVDGWAVAVGGGQDVDVAAQWQVGDSRALSPIRPTKPSRGTAATPKPARTKLRTTS